MIHLETVWREEPDEGIWEVRGPRRHFTYSKVMVWVAFDRGVKSIEEFGPPGPLIIGGGCARPSTTMFAATPSMQNSGPSRRAMAQRARRRP